MSGYPVIYDKCFSCKSYLISKYQLFFPNHSRCSLHTNVQTQWAYVFCMLINLNILGDQKFSTHLIITVQRLSEILTIPTQLMIWRWQSQNTFGVWIMLYWIQSSRTQFSVSINVRRLAGDTLNTACNFLYCNHQVHRDFLITLYISFLYLNTIQYIYVSLTNLISVTG
jgi:hypothetical protein